MKIKLSYFLHYAVVIGFMMTIQSAAASLPEESIYQLTSQWTDQNGKSLKLTELAGKKRFVALIYTQCLHTCPTIVSTLKSIENRLTDDQKNKTGFVLISLTPESDTPKVLKEFSEARKLDSQYWTLLTGNASDVRSLAMTLNIKYQAAENNEVAHSNMFTLLDEQGKIVFQEIGDIQKVDSVVERMNGAHQ